MEPKSMIVETSRFGEIEIDERKVITILQGVLGFSDEKRYFFVTRIPPSNGYRRSIIQNWPLSPSTL